MSKITALKHFYTHRISELNFATCWTLPVLLCETLYLSIFVYCRFMPFCSQTHSDGLYILSRWLGVFRKSWAILHNFTHVQIVIVLFNCTLSNKSINIFDRIPHVYLLSSHLDLLSLSLQSVCFLMQFLSQKVPGHFGCVMHEACTLPPLSGTHIIKHAHTHSHTGTLTLWTPCFIAVACPNTVYWSQLHSTHTHTLITLCRKMEDQKAHAHTPMFTHIQNQW